MKAARGAIDVGTVLQITPPTANQKKPMRRLTIVAALLLTACSQWTRPDTTEAEFKRDSDECDREA